MDGKGWRPEFGISAEGIQILGFVEALPREVRRELLEAVAATCKKQGYLSLHDDLRPLMSPEPRADTAPAEGLAKVIPLFKRAR